MNRLTAFAPVFLIVMFSCMNKSSESNLEVIQKQQSMEEINKSVVLSWLNEVNRDNYEVLFDELWTKSSKQYFNSSSIPIEYDDFKEMVYNLYEQMPIIKHEVYDIIAKEDKVIVRFSANVLHDTLMFGVPATGKEIVWNAIAIFQLSDGKIQNRWEVTDELGKLDQLGMKLN